MVDEKNSSDIDDWLDDLQEEDTGSANEELAQSDIDALLGGGGEEESVPAPAQDEELAQSDIDALLGGGGEEESAPAPAQDEELAQSDIDSLFGGGEAEKAVAEALDAPDNEELDQSDIDSLFGDVGEEQEQGATAEEETPSQAEMDQLFDDAGTEESSAGETVSFSEVLDSETSGAEAFDLGPDETGMSGDDFNFDDDIPDIPDEEEATVGVEEEGTLSEEMFAEEVPEFFNEPGGQPPQKEEEGKKLAIPFSLPFSTPVAAAVACFLIILAGSGLYFFKFRDKAEPPAIIMPPQQVAQTAPQPEEVAPPAKNSAPVAEEARLEMPPAGGEVAVQLSGLDADKDTLQFQIAVPPEHGRLSGDLPNVTYLPNNDFPGEDRFSFTASDGREVSAPATVVITGPSLRKKPVVEAKTIKPKRPLVRAKNVTLKTVSTDPLVIDWQKIWKLANKSPYTRDVSVEITKSSLRGRLVKLGPDKYEYVPDKFHGGNEVLSYRFKKDGVKSKTRQLMVMVELGDPAPEIHLKSLAENYKVGETVVLDAGPTRDDERDSLMFAWEQVAGVPVQLEILNDQGSAIAFVVPSSFYTDHYPQPVIRLTAVDQSGQADSRNIEINTESRRQTALWRGTRDGNIAVEPSCRNGNCPGELLPWPYPD